MNLPEKFNAMVITLSDRAFSGEYEDLSGPAIREKLSDFFRSLGWNCNIDLILIPDDQDRLKALLKDCRDKYNLVITTGGTGIGPKDITVETVRPLLSKEIPGVMEFIRVKYGTRNPAALLSRGISGIMGKALIYTLPGSVRAVNEYMAEIVRMLEHTFMMQYGIDTHGTISG
jgi:molybdenum cofactor synthesis domain-containing protein